MCPIYFGDQQISKMYVGSDTDPVTEINFGGQVVNVSGEFGQFPPLPSPDHHSK